MRLCPRDFATLSHLHAAHERTKWRVRVDKEATVLCPCGHTVSVLGYYTTVKRPLRKHGHSQDIECIASEYRRRHHRMIMCVGLGAGVFRQSIRTEQVSLCQETGLCGREIVELRHVELEMNESREQGRFRSCDLGGGQRVVLPAAAEPAESSHELA
jgi:hypothetical protein